MRRHIRFNLRLHRDILLLNILLVLSGLIYLISVLSSAIL